MTQMFLSKFNVSGSSIVFLWHDLSCRVRWKKWAGSSSGFIQLFRERLSRQSRKVIWDMIDTLFLTAVAVEPTFVAFL